MSTDLSHLQGIIWTRNVKELDLQADKRLIIHHTLRYGTLSQLHWLNNVYGPAEVKRVFREEPMNIYDAPSLSFIARIWLRLSNHDYDPYAYLESAPRHPR